MSCRSDSDCRVLFSGDDPPIGTFGCFAYVNAEGFIYATPLIAQWQSDCFDGGSPPCPGGGAATCSDAGTCGPQ